MHDRFSSGEDIPIPILRDLVGPGDIVVLWRWEEPPETYEFNLV
jgi:hypothetical protein